MTGKHFKPWAIRTVLLGLLALMSWDTQAAVHFRTVALSGETAPGTSTVFRRFDGATINNIGNVVLSAHLPYNEFGVTASGVWAEPQGELVYLALEGDPAPGYDPGTEYLSIRGPSMDDAGRVTFSASVRGPGVDFTNSSAIWHYSEGSSSIVMQLGQPVPGLPGVEFSGWFSPKINASGKITIGATLQGSVTDLTNSGFWTQEAGPLQAVIFEGQAAPGTTPGTVFGAGGNLNAFQFF